jgi:ribosomal protein S27AE
MEAAMESEKCKKCGSTSFEARHKGPHIGWYCTKCGAWLRWIPQYRKRKREPEPHQISIDEFMQEAAPEQATMKDEDIPSLYDDDDLPWE